MSQVLPKDQLVKAGWVRLRSYRSAREICAYDLIRLQRNCPGIECLAAACPHTVTHKVPLLTRQLSSNVHKLLQFLTGHAHVGLSWGWQSRHCQNRGSCGGPGTWAARRPRLASAARTLDPCAAGAYMPAHPCPACWGPCTRRPRNTACWFATLGPAQTEKG